VTDADAVDPSAIRAVAALGDDVRRGLYEFARATRRPVSRDEAAEAIGISRKLAAFHLDKLAAAGGTTKAYLRPPGRTGPGAGRPAKLYRRAPEELTVSVPPRRYDLAAEVLADAIERGRAFLEAGAPVVFVPGRLTEEQVGALVEALGPQRLTLLPAPGSPPLGRLVELGVARVSFGPFPQRVALTALQEMVEGVARGEGVPDGTRPLT